MSHASVSLVPKTNNAKKDLNSKVIKKSSIKTKVDLEKFILPKRLTPVFKIG